MTACWNDDANLIKRARGWKDDILKTLEETKAEVEEMEQHPVGLFSRTKGFRQYFILQERRKKLAAQLDFFEDRFPSDDRLVDGPNNTKFLKEGVIAVKRFQGDKEEYHWIGTFGFRKFACGKNDA